jgi:serine kinase of HPr protein (carbohydrate metabolism regulator)
MLVSELLQKVKITALNKVYDKDIVGGLVTDMVSDVMTSGQAGYVWVTVQTNKKVISAANLVDIAAVVIPQGKKVEPEVLQAADSAQITIFSTDFSSWDFVGAVYALGIRISPYSPVY